jgi:hypothetical protein
MGDWAIEDSFDEKRVGQNYRTVANAAKAGF